MSALRVTNEVWAYLVRVSVSWPFIGSRTVRSRTPFWRPMFTNIVGWVLLMLASSMSAMQMDDGGAVRACRLMVSRVVSGSRDTIRTVWSSHPTACKDQINIDVGVIIIRKKTYKVWRALPPLRHLPNTQRKNRAPHRLPILILIQLPVQIKLEVHELRGAQRDDDLAPVRRRAHDRHARGHAPLVHAAVREHVADAVRVHLQ